MHNLDLDRRHRLASASYINVLKPLLEISQGL
jgi:hypothetical protein